MLVNSHKPSVRKLGIYGKQLTDISFKPGDLDFYMVTIPHRTSNIYRNIVLKGVPAPLLPVFNTPTP